MQYQKKVPKTKRDDLTYMPNMKPDKPEPNLREQFQLYMSSIFIDYHHHASKQSIKKAVKMVLAHETELAKKK